MGIFRVFSVLLVFSLLLSFTPAFADDELIIHGLVSQGYLNTSKYDYLGTSEDGSAEFNEFILNFQKQMNEKLRVGMQLLSRDLGKEGNNKVKIDWGYGDYRFDDNWGIRFGRVKVPFGLYNQYRDIDMLRTSVLLPTSIYMEDYRTFITAFNGGSLYGTVPFENSSLDLEVAVGEADFDPESGVIKDILGTVNSNFEALSTAKLYAGLGANPGTAPLVPALQNAGVKIAHVGDPDRDTESKLCYSAKMLWNTPVEGLKIGANRTDVEGDLNELLIYQPLIVPLPPAGALTTLSPGFTTNVDVNIHFKVDVGSLEYTKNKFTFSTELMAAHATQKTNILTSTGTAVKSQASRTSKGHYYQLVYRHDDKNEWGVYRGELLSDKNNVVWQEYHKDTCLSYRYNVTRDWSIKLEYHWMNGTGQLQNNLNTAGYPDQKWNLVAFKTTYNF